MVVPFNDDVRRIDLHPALRSEDGHASQPCPSRILSTEKYSLSPIHAPHVAAVANAVRGHWEYIDPSSIVASSCVKLDVLDYCRGAWGLMSTVARIVIATSRDQRTPDYTRH